MRTTLLSIATALVVFFSSCSTSSYVQSSAGTDDMYANGSSNGLHLVTPQANSQPQKNASPQEQADVMEPNVQPADPNSTTAPQSETYNNSGSGSGSSNYNGSNFNDNNGYYNSPSTGWGSPSFGMTMSPYYSGFNFYMPYYITPGLSLSLGFSYGYGYGGYPYYPPYYYPPYYPPFGYGFSYGYNPYCWNPYNPYYNPYYGYGDPGYANNGTYYGPRGSAGSNTSNGYGGRYQGNSGRVANTGGSINESGSNVETASEVNDHLEKVDLGTNLKHIDGNDNDGSVHKATIQDLKNNTTEQQNYNQQKTQSGRPRLNWQVAPAAMPNNGQVVNNQPIEPTVHFSNPDINSDPSNTQDKSNSGKKRFSLSTSSDQQSSNDGSVNIRTYKQQSDNNSRPSLNSQRDNNRWNNNSFDNNSQRSFSPAPRSNDGMNTRQPHRN